MEDNELTTRDVLGMLAGMVLIIASIIALFALIWAAWKVFRIALTVIAIVCLAVSLDWYIQGHKKPKV